MSASALLTRCQRRIHHEIGFANGAQTRCSDSKLIFSCILEGLARRGLATEAPKSHRLAVGILLNRSPILTRTPTKFEREFYKYQQRIQRSLHNPFPSEFYFKQGSVLEAQFSQEEINREKKAFGDDFVSQDALEKASLMLKVENTGEEEEKPVPRRTDADDKRDVKSLDRLGSRNLYLLVKGSPGTKYEWRFPRGYVEKGEYLHQVLSSSSKIYHELTDFPGREKELAR